MIIGGTEREDAGKLNNKLQVFSHNAATIGWTQCLQRLAAVLCGGAFVPTERGTAACNSSTVKSLVKFAPTVRQQALSNILKYSQTFSNILKHLKTFENI